MQANWHKDRLSIAPFTKRPLREALRTKTDSKLSRKVLSTLYCASILWEFLQLPEELLKVMCCIFSPCWRPCRWRSGTSGWFPADPDTSPAPPWSPRPASGRTRLDRDTQKWGHRENPAARPLEHSPPDVPSSWARTHAYTHTLPDCMREWEWVLLSASCERSPPLLAPSHWPGPCG